MLIQFCLLIAITIFLYFSVHCISRKDGYILLVQFVPSSALSIHGMEGLAQLLVPVVSDLVFIEDVGCCISL